MNFAICLFFIFEIFLKLLAVGVEKFNDDIFNIYEIIITLTIIVKFINITIFFIKTIHFQYFKIELTEREENYSILSSLKSFRIFRIFFFNKKWDYFQILLEALGNCLLPTASFAVIYVNFLISANIFVSL